MEGYISIYDIDEQRRALNQNPSQIMCLGSDFSLDVSEYMRQTDHLMSSMDFHTSPMMKSTKTLCQSTILNSSHRVRRIFYSHSKHPIQDVILVCKT